jgi:hypothetical protein
MFAYRPPRRPKRTSQGKNGAIHPVKAMKWRLKRASTAADRFSHYAQKTNNPEFIK